MKYLNRSDSLKLEQYFNCQKYNYNYIMKFIDFLNSFQEKKIFYQVNFVFCVASSKIQLPNPYEQMSLFSFNKSLPPFYIYSVKDCIDKFERFKKLGSFI